MDKSLVNAASRRGVESDIGPRLILGGTAALMAPTGAATSAGLYALRTAGTAHAT